MKKDTSKRISVYVDKKVYQDFKMYGVMINRSVSSLLEEHMRNVIKEMKKEK